MGLSALISIVIRDLLGAALGRGPVCGVDKASKGSSVGVSGSQLTRLQVRCLLAACGFWAVASAVALPSFLIFGLLLIPAWILAEAAFLIWYSIVYRRLNAQPAPHRPPPDVDPRQVFDRFIHDQAALSRYISITDMVSRWHWNVPATQLTRRNVADL